MSKVAHNLNCLLIKKRTIMSFEYDGIELKQLKEQWLTIQSNLPSELCSKLKQYLEQSLANTTEANTVDLYDFVSDCCEYMPANFKEYIAMLMIATSIELLKVPSSFRTEKSRLLAHAFSIYADPWSHDQEKVSTLTRKLVAFIELKSSVSLISGYGSG